MEPTDPAPGTAGPDLGREGAHDVRASSRLSMLARSAHPASA